MCLYYIVAAMMEYALILACNSWVTQSRKDNRVFDFILRSLDKVMFILFPTMFGIHIYVFWKPIQDLQPSLEE